MVSLLLAALFFAGIHLGIGVAHCRLPSNDR
jgi:hypothetical protein